MSVGIIIPMYNSENSITETIESCVNQTFNDIRIYVVNDGSTDNSGRIVENLMEKDSRIILLDKENGGVSSARNLGLEAALDDGCEYISFLDADDFYELSFIQEMFDEIHKNNKDVVYCGFNIVKNDAVVKVKTEFSERNVLQKYISGKVKVHMTGWMVRSKLLYDLRFSENLSWGEDHLFFYNVLGKTERIGFVNQYLTNYVDDDHSGRLSADSLDKINKDIRFISEAMSLETIKNDQKHIRLLREYKLPGLIVYRLIRSLDESNIDQIRMLYRQNYEYIKPISYVNGLRSIKLKISNELLKRKIRM